MEMKWIEIIKEKKAVLWMKNEIVTIKALQKKKFQTLSWSIKRNSKKSSRSISSREMTNNKKRTFFGIKLEFPYENLMVLKFSFPSPTDAAFYLLIHSFISHNHEISQKELTNLSFVYFAKSNNEYSPMKLFLSAGWMGRFLELN